jgi:hypothetical protein
MRPMKKKGVVIERFISFKGVLIMKQEQTLGLFSICLNSFYSIGFVTCSSKSTGLLPYLSLASLEAPLISKDLTGLVLFNESTDFTAKCSGV